MRKQISCAIDGARKNIGWLSFQPDGSISFGLNDRYYIVPRSKSKIGIFNAYNRVRAEFILRSDPATLVPVVNPHFTYHPIAIFHLRANGDEELFRGICDTTIVLEQQSELPWIRAISNPLSTISTSGVRADDSETEHLVLSPPPNDCSIAISVDLIKSPPPTNSADSSTEIMRHIV
jgi:hypothetical protein